MKDELFPTETEAEKYEAKQRGKYDLSILESKNPKLVKAIVYALQQPGAKFDVIAKGVGVSWETVAAISQHKQGTIREFKAGLAAKLQVCVEAATGVMLDKINQGKIDVLGFKLLTETWAMIAGEATQIVLNKHEIEYTPDASKQTLEMLRASAAQTMGLGTVKNSTMTDEPEVINGTIEILPKPDLVGNNHAKKPTE